MRIIISFHLTNGSVWYGSCTSGFVAYSTAYTGSLTYGIITAGHCAEPSVIANLIDHDYPIIVYYTYTDSDGASRYVAIGEFWVWREIPDVSFAIFYNNVSSYPSVRWIDGTERPVAEVRNPQQGVEVITLGATSGHVSSIIEYYRYDYHCWIADFVNRTTLPGDSGAPVVEYNSFYDVVYAIGIHSGRIEYQTSSGETVYYQCFASAVEAEDVLAAHVDTW